MEMQLADVHSDSISDPVGVVVTDFFTMAAVSLYSDTPLVNKNILSKFYNPIKLTMK